MRTILILSFITDDRPGLTSAISEAIAGFQGNWMESRLSLMAGKFTGVLQISVPTDNVSPLRDTLSQLKDGSISWLVEEVADRPISAGASISLRIDLVGNDRTGIIQDVTDILSALNLNIADMTSEFSDAPMSSEKLFRASILVSGPETIEETLIEERLESLANELMIEVSRNGE